MAAVSVRSLCGDGRDSGFAKRTGEVLWRIGLDDEEEEEGDEGDAAAQAWWWWWAIRRRCASTSASASASLALDDVLMPAEKSEVRLPDSRRLIFSEFRLSALRFLFPRSCASHFSLRAAGIGGSDTCEPPLRVHGCGNRC